MNILIIKLGAIGDVLRTASLLEPLKERYKGCSIAWVTKRNAFGLLKNNPHINNIYFIENNPSFSQEFSLVLNLDDDENACRLASDTRKKSLVGAYIENGKKTYTQDSALWFDMGLISRFGKKNADELKALNKKTYQEIHFSILGLKDWEKYTPALILDDISIDFAWQFAERKGIGKSDFIAGFNTGAGGRWQDKKLSIADTVELIKKMQHAFPEAKIILFGGPEEEKRNRDILEKTIGVIDAGCNNSLLDFAALVDLCSVLVTSDSLAMHIGIGLGKKVVAFFYPTSASEIELYNKGVKIIAKGKDYCSYKAKCENPPEWNLDEFVEGVKRLK